MERNWAGNITYQAPSVTRPQSLDQLRQIVADSPRVRVLGTRHSFNDIADSPVLVDVAGLRADVVFDTDAMTVEVSPSMTYGRLAPLLHGRALALHNLASLPHISIGGAVATGTHGSGDRLGNLATAVCALDLLRSDGEVVHLQRGDADFDGVVVGLGALGVVLRVRLDVEPEYEIAQRVFEQMPWDVLAGHLDQITGAGYSVSCFTTWGAAVDQVWVKSRRTAVDSLFDARPATADLHPIAGVSAEHCTPQLGQPGQWSDRLPHFKMGFTPSSGDELQSELLLPRSAVHDAIDIVRGLATQIAPHLLVSEIRTVAADSLWMSPQHERDTVAIHFTWRPHAAEVERLVELIERSLAPFEPRPHWGKVFAMDAATIASRYPRHHDFVDLLERLDPRGAFRNRWLDRTILADS